jgi:glucan phosphoethanolaminetransferase (alkaline phosphatase superfamily)
MQLFRNLVFSVFAAWAIWASLPYIYSSFAHASRTAEVSWLAAFFFAFGLLASLYALGRFMFLDSRSLRVLIAAFLGFGFAADFGLQLANGVWPGPSGLLMSEIADFTRLAVNEFRNIPDLVQDYVPWVLFGLLVIVLLIAAAWITPAKPRKTTLLDVVSVPLAFGLTLAMVLQPNTLSRLQAVAPFQFTALATKVMAFDQKLSVAKRDEPFFAPKEMRKINKIVFIVDESVRGDYLTANTPGIDSTPALAALAPQMLNYGVATPIANCSTATRFALRTGIRARDLPDEKRLAFILPTIWQYAHKAGLKTVHIDAFSRKNVLHSFMSRFELSQIDERILPVEKAPFLEIDNEAARILKTMLDRPEPMFIYLEKVGVHFPHNGRNAPKDLAYEPADMVQFQTGLQPSNHEAIRHYLRALRWRVDGFFDMISNQLNRDDTLIVYTSDHGQNMFEGKTTVQHCNVRFDGDGSARVPLMLFTGNSALKAAFETGFSSWQGKASHDPLFPTLLRLMGYGAEDVSSKYGATLLDQRPETVRNYILLDLFTGKLQAAE